MLVHAVIEVPDEEGIDNRLPATVQYIGYKESGLCKKTVEGFLEPLRELINEDIEMLTTKIQDGDVILFKYPWNVDPEDAVLIQNILQAEFPEHKVLGFTKDVDLLVENVDEAVAMLEKMIAHIKISSNRPKILLE